MKILSALLTAALLLAGVGVGHAGVRIADDRGGQIGEYLYRYSELRASGQTVMIDGLCASACTILLSAISHDKICVTSNATLGFHAAFDFAGNGRTVTNPEATEMLYSGYPPQVRRWITRRGGLTPRMIFLRGKQLQAMYRPCRPGYREGGVNVASRERYDPYAWAATIKTNLRNKFGGVQYARPNYALVERVQARRPSSSRSHH